MDLALRQLCQVSQTLLGLVAMILIVLSFIFYVANDTVNRFFKPPKYLTNRKNRPLLWKLSVLSLALAVVLIIIYIMAPIVADWLGIESAYDKCLRDSDTFEEPHCGEYCYNKSVAPLYDDCNCLIH